MFVEIGQQIYWYWPHLSIVTVLTGQCKKKSR